MLAEFLVCVFVLSDRHLCFCLLESAPYTTQLEYCLWTQSLECLLLLTAKEEDYNLYLESSKIIFETYHNTFLFFPVCAWQTVSLFFFTDVRWC